MGGRYGMHGNIPYLQGISGIHTQSIFFIHPVGSYLFPEKLRKYEFCLRSCLSPDLPCFMIDMIQMIMCPQKGIDPFKLACRYRHRSLPVFIIGCIIVNTNRCLPRFYHKPHLSEPS